MIYAMPHIRLITPPHVNANVDTIPITVRISVKQNYFVIAFSE